MPRESSRGKDLIQQRNKMIFDEDTGSEGAQHHQQNVMTLNKYESKKDLAQKNAGTLDSEQMETAHWNKNGNNGALSGQGNSEATKTTNPDKDLINQRGFMSEHGSNYVGS